MPNTVLGARVRVVNKQTKFCPHGALQPAIVMVRCIEFFNDKMLHEFNHFKFNHWQKSVEEALA